MRVADGLPRHARELARDELFSLGHVEQRGAINSRTESQRIELHFKASGQTSQQFGFSVKVQEHTGAAVR